MKSIVEYFNDFGRVVKTIQLTDVLDIILVTILIYQLIRLVQTTNTGRVLKTVAVVLLLSWVTQIAELHVLNFLLTRVLELGLIAVVVLFQPELRRAVDRLGSTNLRQLLSPKEKNLEIDNVISHTVAACEAMSKEKVGALVVFERTSRLDEYLKTGTAIDGKVTDQLLRNIFFPKAALHDGAMIVRGGRVAAAGCVLPLSDNRKISADLGTRHRAGIGISELTDAVVVIVSEETGTLSVAVGGMLKRHLAPETLGKLLQNELNPTNEEVRKSFKLGWGKKQGGKDGQNEK